MKIYLKACKECNERVQAHTIASETKRGFLLKCHKCKTIGNQSHTKTFLKNREIDLEEF